jgi:hypothetical protein
MRCIAISNTKCISSQGHGTGLGKGGKGIYDPIPLTSKDIIDVGSKVGIGRVEEENDQHQVATEKRKDLESEVQV